MTPTEIEKLVITVVTESQKAMRDLDEVQRKVEEQDRKNIKAFKEQLEVIRRGQLGRGGRFIEDVQQGFSNAVKDGTNYTSVLKGIAVAYGVVKVAQLGVANSLEEIGFQADRSAKLQAKLIEQMNFRTGQTFQDAAAMDFGNRIKTLQDNLAKEQSVLGGFARQREQAEEKLRDSRGPNSMTGGKSQYDPYSLTGVQALLEDATGILVRNLSPVHSQRHDEAVRNAKEAEELSDNQRKAVEKYQRALKDLEIGGSDATQALDRFRTKMKEHVDAISGGAKAIVLARLETEHNLSEDQKKEAERIHSQVQAIKDQFEMIKNMKESERHFKEKISRKEDEILSHDPVHRFRKEMEELEADLAGGMGFDVFSLGVRQAEERLKSATGASNKFRESSVNFSHSLVGSGEAADKIRRQIDVNTAKREDIPILKKIESNTRRKTTGQKVVDIKPAGVGGP